MKGTDILPQTQPIDTEQEFCMLVKITNSQSSCKVSQIHNPCARHLKSQASYYSPLWKRNQHRTNLSDVPRYNSPLIYQMNNTQILKRKMGKKIPSWKER